MNASTSTPLASAAPLLFGVALIVSTGCAGTRPDHIGPTQDRLATCPASPNCVVSDAADEGHRVAPLVLRGDAAVVWPEVVATVAAMPATRVVVSNDRYLHAESTSALMGYVDDLELMRALEGSTVAVRSASRVGYGDMGVNRARVDTLRAELRARGLLAD